MLDSGFMPPLHPRSSDKNVHVGGCVVVTRDKTTVFLPMGEDYCLHYILFLIHLSVAHKASTSLPKLNTRRICWIAFPSWTLRYGCMLDSGPYALT